MKIRFRSINAIEEFLDIVNRFSAEIEWRLLQLEMNQSRYMRQ